MSSTEELIEGLDAKRLGERLRELRAEAGLSLRELAGRLDISVSAVSQIERGVMQPSVNRLFAIVAALGVPLARVFDESGRARNTAGSSPTGFVIARHGEITPVPLGEGVLYRRLSPTETTDVDFFESTYPPHSFAGAEHELNAHRGYEIGTVTAGELTIEFPTESVTLGAGDSITYPSDVPHQIRNAGDVPAVATWLIVHP